MRKFLFCLITFTFSLAALACSCAAGGVDYTSFISERRSDVYLFGDDGAEVKVYIVQREQPYVSDGYCGSMTMLCEIYASFEGVSGDVSVDIGGQGGEMSYMSVTDSYYISFTPESLGERPELTFTMGGSTRTIVVESVLYDGVISPEEAVICASEYDSALFESLVNGKNFEGEIYVRLIADEGKCYYYVGVCDRNSNTSAYLVDGEKGNIIAERKL